MAVNARVHRGPHRSERLSLLVLAIAFAVAAAVATAGPGQSATNSDGALAVTVTPTEALADGQPVSIHAETSGGAQIFELRAHLCQAGAGIDNTSEFGFQGPYCPNGPIGAGQFDESVVPPSGSTTADLQFAVGMGGITWLDEQGYVHDLTCGPASSCDLVVEAQLTNDTAFVTFPLLIGEGSPPPPPPPSSTDPPAAAAAADAGTGTNTGSGNGAGAGAGPNSPAAGKLGGSEAAAAAGSSATRSSASGKGSGGGVLSTIGDAVDAVASGDPQFSQSERVFAGGVAGVIGGVLVVLIIARARRRMSAQVA
jgi:hypothetical protein